MLMKTKLTLSLLTALALGFALLGATGCKKAGAENKAGQQTAATKYTCPMHPEVVQDSPGNCPKCGMKLVEKK